MLTAVLLQARPECQGEVKLPRPSSRLRRSQHLLPDEMWSREEVAAEAGPSHVTQDSKPDIIDLTSNGEACNTSNSGAINPTNDSEVIDLTADDD